MSYIVKQQLVQPDTAEGLGEEGQWHGLVRLIGASHNALIGWPDTELDERSGEYVRVEVDMGRLHELLPDGRGSTYKTRVNLGWTYAEIAEIVQLLQRKVDQLRKDAAALQANPVEVVNPSDPWGDTLVFVGDVSLLKAADEVEELIKEWRGETEV